MKRGKSFEQRLHSVTSVLCPQAGRNPVRERSLRETVLRQTYLPQSPAFTSSLARGQTCLFEVAARPAVNWGEEKGGQRKLNPAEDIQYSTVKPSASSCRVSNLLSKRGRTKKLHHNFINLFLQSLHPHLPPHIKCIFCLANAM